MQRATFINKTANSGNVSRSTPAERRQINERNRAHRRAARRDRSGHTSETETSDFDSPAPAETAVLQGSTESEIAEQLMLAKTFVPSFSTGISRTVGSPHDPFETSSIPLNGQVVKLLRYYKEAYYLCLWAGISFALEERLGRIEIPRASPEAVIIECMSNRTRMYALLANAACHLQHDVETGNGISRLRLIQRGTAALREDMRANDGYASVDTLVAAIHLYMASKAYHQAEAAQAHLQGAKAILRKLLEQRTPINLAQLGLCAVIDIELVTQLLRNVSPAELNKDPNSAQLVPSLLHVEYRR